LWRPPDYIFFFSYFLLLGLDDMGFYLK